MRIGLLVVISIVACLRCAGQDYRFTYRKTADSTHRERLGVRHQIRDVKADLGYNGMVEGMMDLFKNLYESGFSDGAHLVLFTDTSRMSFEKRAAAPRDFIQPNGPFRTKGGYHQVAIGVCDDIPPAVNFQCPSAPPFPAALP